jgi:electron transport complex protein RnfB
VAFRITESCAGCGGCKKKCPWAAIVGDKKAKHVIEPTICMECGTCWYTCPKSAVEDPEGFVREKGKVRMPKASIDNRACAGCRNCLLNCERGAIEFENSLFGGKCHVAEDDCIGCGRCLLFCASGCIDVA